jgi:AraC-like DNA-binding protein
MQPQRISEAAATSTSGDARFEVVNLETLRFFPELVASLDGDPAPLLRRAKIDPFIFAKKGSVLEYRGFVALLEMAALTLQRPDFGMRLAQLQAGDKVIGPVGVVMKNSSTMGQALGYCAKNIHAYSLATRVRFAPDRPHHKLFVGLEILLDNLPGKAQALEHGLLLANRNIMDITGGAARARSVSFRHRPVSSLETYRELFGCEVRFGQKADGLTFSEDDLLCKIVAPDEQVYEMATSFVDARFPPATPPMHARVRGLVRQLLGGDSCTNEFVSSELCLHPRTLQRRLRLEGASFESIKDDVRKEVAAHYLGSTDLPLSRVAEKLGYAEASVLSRSCYRWFGAAPLQVRRQGVPAPCEAGAGA